MINERSLYLAKMLTNLYHKSAMHKKLDTMDIIPTDLKVQHEMHTILVI